MAYEDDFESFDVSSSPLKQEDNDDLDFDDLFGDDGPKPVKKAKEPKKMSKDTTLKKPTRVSRRKARAFESSSAAGKSVSASSGAAKVPIISKSQVIIDESKCLGSGSFCNVYRGRFLEVPVACKQVFAPNPTKQQSLEFQREAESYALFQHPHIVQSFGYVKEHENDTKMILCMEYCSGGSLYDCLFGVANKVILSKPLKRQACLELASALAFVHSKNRIHRDLKTGNILVSYVDNNRILLKLCDFGLCIEENFVFKGSSKLYMPYAGTPNYLAPEVLSRSKLPSTKSDIYALAIIFNEIWSGQIPFEGLDVASITECVVSRDERPAMKAFVPKAMASLIESMWHKDPASRPTMEEVLQKLTKI